MIKIYLVLSFMVYGSTTLARSSSEKITMGNPAARFCENTLEGRSIATKDVDGESALCDLEGAQVEQWTLYRQLMQKSSQQAVQVYLSLTEVALKKIHGSALSVCKKKSGEVLSVQHEEGAIQLCRFQDGSIIELNTLSAGVDAEKNRKLTATLKKAESFTPNQK